MKVILVRDVARLGRKSEVKEVPSGHAQNFLIPRKLAVPATPENMKRLAAEIGRHSEEEAERKRLFDEALRGLGETKVLYEAPANKEGHLFKGVNARDIAAKIQALGFTIGEDEIVLEHPIKTVGTHSVTLRQGSAEGACTVEIVGM